MPSFSCPRCQSFLFVSEYCSRKQVRKCRQIAGNEPQKYAGIAIDARSNAICITRDHHARSARRTAKRVKLGHEKHIRRLETPQQVLLALSSFHPTVLGKGGLIFRQHEMKSRPRSRQLVAVKVVIIQA
jgi:hypothetical protein